MDLCLGSLVAYVLDITGISPLKNDLLFERFLNEERYSMPDIDIDFLSIEAVSSLLGTVMVVSTLLRLLPFNLWSQAGYSRCF